MILFLRLKNFIPPLNLSENLILNYKIKHYQMIFFQVSPPLFNPGIPGSYIWWGKTAYPSWMPPPLSSWTAFGLQRHPKKTICGKVWRLLFFNNSFYSRYNKNWKKVFKNRIWMSNSGHDDIIYNFSISWNIIYVQIVEDNNLNTWNIKKRIKVPCNKKWYRKFHPLQLGGPQVLL